jgi:hypothetical protein
LQGLDNLVLQKKTNRIGRSVAIEPSRQFKNQAIDNRLKLAQINKLESDSAKSRQEVMESIQNMYGVRQAPNEQ